MRGIFCSACFICSSPSWYGLRGDRWQHTLSTWDWDCLSMWSGEQWGSAGCSQAIFQRNSSLGDVNQMQPFAVLWLSGFIFTPSCKIQIRKSSLIFFPLLCQCSDSFCGQNINTVSHWCASWLASHPARASLVLSEIIIVSVTSWAGEFLGESNLKTDFQIHIACHTWAHSSFIRNKMHSNTQPGVMCCELHKIRSKATFKFQTSNS